MPIPTSFAEVVSISNDQALLNSKLNFSREQLVTRESLKGPGLDGLLFTRPDGKAINKPIRADRMVLKYEDVVQHMIDQLDSTGVAWKFKTVAVTKQGGLYSEVLFDLLVPTPDDNPISAMAIIRSDLVSNPLTIKFGTYRFVCMNGVTVGKTISDLVIRSKMAPELFETSLQDQFSRAFSDFEKVGLKYQRLLDTPLSASLTEFLESDETPFTLKKMVLKQLEKDTIIRMEPKVKLKDIREAPNETYSLIVENGTKWTLYNALTNASTWQTDSFGPRVRQYGMISESMGV